jgi:uncharacterized protein
VLLSRSREPLLLPSPVLVELDHLLSKHGLNPRAFSQLLTDIQQGNYRVLDLAPMQYARVQELYNDYADLRLGFVDAAIVAMAEELQERRIATVDHRDFTVVRPKGLGHFVLLP